MSKGTRLEYPNPNQQNQMKGENGNNSDNAGRFTEHKTNNVNLANLVIIEGGNGDQAEQERSKLIQERNAKLEEVRSLNDRINGLRS